MVQSVRRKQFLQYVEQIKQLGYRVFIRKDEFTTFGWVVNEKEQIGYFQLDDWGTGLCFSTVHKPCTKFGSGFGLDTSLESKTTITKAIVDRVFVTYPGWARRYKDIARVKKYTLGEFIEYKKSWWDDLYEA